MRFLQSTLALLALPATIIAVSLSDFTPRVSDLPSNCEAVYTDQIVGCSSADFASPKCTPGCIKALNSYASTVKSACGNQGIEGGNIITTFLSGGGPSGLCSNADSVLGGGSESSESTAATPSASTTPKSSTVSSTSAASASPTASSTTETSSSSSAVLSGTATATSLATSTSTTNGESSSGILVDTSSIPSATSTSTSSSGGNSQTNMNDNSGGGSPFDSEGNMNSLASISTWSITTVLISTATLLFATLR